ncbi:ABC transporter permease [Ideonella sp. DXS29W]|uniref:ABC transporter permease n=1 Tax=Ideonella lacteola TaxID=2984193 RepID=A0ABU9BUZ3_9BURK
MLAYYFDLALRSFKSARALSLLMIVALGLGIGACMTTLTVYKVLSGDPIPHKSDRLFNVQIDAGNMIGYEPGQEPMFQLTRFDAEALLRARHAKRQVMMSGANVPVQPESPTIKPFFSVARYATTDFFAMFDVPFLYGSGWDADADANRARVAVITDDMNNKLFGGENSVGREIRIRSEAFRIVGVMKPWKPVPHFYDMTMGMTEYEQVLLPFSTAMGLKFGTSGTLDCWGNNNGQSPRDLNAPCAWVQYWVELESPDQAPAFRDYLIQYSEEQRRAGRFERPPNVRLRNVVDWLSFQKALPSDVRLQVWLAFGFLLVCLTNTVGLLLAKCLRRSGEIGVRRALGATRRDVFAQFIVEAGTIGLAGGALGLVLAVLGLWLVQHSPAQYASLVSMDWPMLSLTLVLALASSLIAGLLPAWHAAHVTPARQLKTQ